MRVAALVLALAPVLAIAAEPSDNQPKVGVLRFTEVNVTPEFASSVAGVVANELDRTGAFRVTTAQAIADLLALERQKQLMGCSEDETCMAEIVDALGLDLMVSGKVTRSGTAQRPKWTVDLTLTNVRKVRREGSQIVHASSEGEALEQARGAARQLVAALLRERSGTLALTVNEPGATVQVDDIAVGVSPLSAPLSLPAGVHRVHVEKKGFVATKLEVRVTPNKESKATATLLPSADYAREYEAGAKRMRLGAWISTAAAVVGLAVGSGMQLRAGALYGQPNQDGTFQFYRARLLAGQENDGTTNFRQRALEVSSEIKSSEFISQLSYAAGGVGAAAAAFFWIVGEDPDRYTQKKVTLIPAPGGVGFAVQF